MNKWQLFPKKTINWLTVTMDKPMFCFLGRKQILNTV